VPYAPDTAGEFIRALIAELHEVWRTPPFLASAARNATSVVGVLFFGWPALNLALYFLLDSWLMLSLYAATDLTFNPKYGGAAPRTAAEAVLKPLPQFLGAAALVGVLVGIFGGFVLTIPFGNEDWQEFLDTGWHESSFLIGALVLTITCLSEAAHFTLRIPARTPVQIRSDDLRVASLFYRLVLLFMASVALGWLRGLPFTVPLFALAMALILVFFEALPRSAGALLGIGAPAKP
jgi:hypothetical protein